MGAQLPADPQQLGCTARLEPCDVGHDDAPQPWIVDVLEPGLEARDILLDLLDEGQMVRQVRQSRVRLDPRPLDRRRTGRDQGRIERVVLGPPQVHAGKGANLDRLQHQNGKVRRPQMRDHAALIASRRLDADACYAGPRQARGKPPPARRCIIKLPTLVQTIDRDIELGFRGIDSGRHCANLCHLRRPCLVKRTKLFRQPSGSDEGAGDDHATEQPQAAQGGLDPITSRSAADGHPRQSIPFATASRYSDSLLQGRVNSELSGGCHSDQTRTLMLPKPQRFAEDRMDNSQECLPDPKRSRGEIARGRGWRTQLRAAVKLVFDNWIDDWIHGWVIAL